MQESWQWTVSSMDRGRSGVWAGVCQESIRGQSGAWTGDVQDSRQWIGRSLDSQRPWSNSFTLSSRPYAPCSAHVSQLAGGWTGNSQEPGQSTSMVRFIHAVKPILCAMVGFRQSTGRSLGRGLVGVLAGDGHESGQWTGRCMSGGRSGVWTGDWQESGQSTVRGRFIHAGKPTVCAVFGSRQSTCMSLCRGLAVVLTGACRSLGSGYAGAWTGEGRSLCSQLAWSGSSTLTSRPYALLSAPVSQLV
jgi:hypothetical protein